jgi:hypothetical protein
MPTAFDTVFKDGLNNSKIGGQVLKGRLKGAHIGTLTLEERTTCPTSCLHWRSCYGNNLHRSTRWTAGPALETSIRRELEFLCREHAQVLVRLHILGDFYSFDYVCLWAEMLDQHPNLTVFGFTAWRRGTALGDAIAKLRGVYPDRFCLRHSGQTGAWGSVTHDYPTERRMLWDMVVCPEQVSAMNGDGVNRHCGSCTLCWSSDQAIVFVEH